MHPFTGEIIFFSKGRGQSCEIARSRTDAQNVSDNEASLAVKTNFIDGCRKVRDERTWPERVTKSSACVTSSADHARKPHQNRGFVEHRNSNSDLWGRHVSSTVWGPVRAWRSSIQTYYRALQFSTHSPTRAQRHRQMTFKSLFAKPIGAIGLTQIIKGIDLVRRRLLGRKSYSILPYNDSVT